MYRYQLKIFFRNFNRYRIFNIINILGLAIGLAATILIGCWIHFHLSFNSCWQKSDRLFRVIQDLRYENSSEWVAPTPSPLAEALIKTLPEIVNSCRIHYSPDLIITAGERSFAEKNALFIDSGFLNMFDIYMTRLKHSSFSGKNLILISESVAIKYFGNDVALGNTVRVADRFDLIVAGIFKDLPPNSTFDFNILLPLDLGIALGHEIFPERWNPFDEIDTYVETSPKCDITSLQEKLINFKSRYIKDNKDHLALQSIKDIHTSTGLRYDLSKIIDPSTIIILGAVSAFLLIVAVFNFIIFSLALSAGRHKEIAIRKINGSSQKNILFSQVGESMILTIISFITCLIIIELISPFIITYTQFPVSMKYIVHSYLFPLSVLVVIFIGLTGGILSGYRLNLINPGFVVKNANAILIQKSRLLKVLVILQFSISLSLLIFASIIISQLKFIENHKVGFDKERLISIKLFDEAKMTLFDNLESFIHEMNSIPDIDAITFSCSSPALIETSAGEVDWDGKKDSESLTVQWNSVFYNYFKTIGAKLVAGRDFSENFENELAGDQKAVFILNETTVRDINLTDQEVLGINFELYGRKGPVIGVVRDFHYKSLKEKIQPMAFFMLPYFYNEIIVRIASGSHYPIKNIEKVYLNLLPDIPFEYSFVDDQYQNIYKSERNLVSYSFVFAFLMIFITTLGLASLSMLILKNRNREIGIRKINGASPVNIVFLLLRFFGKWILAAILISVPFSLYLIEKWLENFTYHIGIKSQFIAGPVFLICIISLLSILIQVVRASGTNPAEVLRYE